MAINYSSSQSVAFTIPNVNHGLQVAKGLLKLGENGIQLEYEVTDAFLGIVDSGVQTTHLNYGDLKSIQFKKGWFRARIILEASSMRIFEELPGTEQATCTLKIKRKDREEAEKIISRARMLHSEYKLDQME